MFRWQDIVDYNNLGKTYSLNGHGRKHIALTPPSIRVDRFSKLPLNTQRLIMRPNNLRDFMRASVNTAKRATESLRGKRTVILSFVYALVSGLSLYLAYEIRFDFEIPAEYQQERNRLIWMVIAVKLMALLVARQMGSMITFFGVPDLARLGFALLTADIILLGPRFVGHIQLSPPRGVLLIDFLVCLAAFCSFRLAARIFRERVLVGQKIKGRAFERVVIIGAGDTGASLVSELLNTPARGFRPVAIFDDDPRKHGKFIHGVRVEGSPELFPNLPGLGGVRRAIVAMPSAPRRRVAAIALFLGRLGMQVEIVPAVEDLASGKARVSQIRPIEVQDLLGRAPIELDNASINNFIENKVVMVTGAGGSIGSEICRQVSQLNPRQLLMVDQSEPALFAIEQELGLCGYGGASIALVADILDENRMMSLFRDHSPNLVFHAAAHKHVYMMERQPSEAIKNNAMGTRKLAEIAAASGAEAFVLISTDKAVNPTNVMGASKRLAELHLQALHAKLESGIKEDCKDSFYSIQSNGYQNRAQRIEEIQGSGSLMRLESIPTNVQPSHTKLMAVRFGNVLGSSGSVVPIFKKQIELGGPVTVTHPDVTRYFMTIPEAVGLVLQASVLGQGGEIFVLDMGQPVKIMELAKNMIELSGLKVGEDIEIVFTGLKQGEKLFEELQHHTETHKPTAHPHILRFLSNADATVVSKLAVADLEPLVDVLTSVELKQNLKLLIAEYQPNFD